MMYSIPVDTNKRNENMIDSNKIPLTMEEYFIKKKKDEEDEARKSDQRRENTRKEEQLYVLKNWEKYNFNIKLEHPFIEKDRYDCEHCLDTNIYVLGQFINMGAPFVYSCSKCEDKRLKLKEYNDYVDKFKEKS